MNALGKIQLCLSTDRWGEAEGPFKLWRGHQLAIGELTTVTQTESSKLLCMGFAQFTRTWKAGGTDGGKSLSADDCSKIGNGIDDDCTVIRGWFSTIEHGIYELESQRQRGDPTGFNRIRRLQHLLLELIDALDPSGARVDANVSKPVGAAPHCDCLRCKALPKKAPGQRY